MGKLFSPQMIHSSYLTCKTIIHGLNFYLLSIIVQLVFILLWLALINETDVLKIYNFKNLQICLDVKQNKWEGPQNLFTLENIIPLVEMNSLSHR